MNIVLRTIRRFFRDHDGQDLAEYCLLMAFVGLVALAIFLKVSGGIQGIWGTANTSLASAPGSTGTSSSQGADSGRDGGSQGH